MMTIESIATIAHEANPAYVAIVQAAAMVLEESSE